MSDRIDQLRRIVTTCTAGKVDGSTVDLFTASAIVAVHDALSDSNRASYVQMPLMNMARTAFIKLVTLSQT